LAFATGTPRSNESREDAVGLRWPIGLVTCLVLSGKSDAEKMLNL
jgi:hypothetical protein